MKKFLAIAYAILIAVLISSLAIPPYFASAASIYSTIQFRRGTEAAWTAADNVLASGEPGYETDTGNWKIGDGLTHWTTLKYQPYRFPTTIVGGLTGDGTGNISGFDNLTLTGSVSGDGTGNISGYDNATFTGRTTTATLTVTGTPTFTDNTINGADIIDNTITVGKLVSYYGYVLPVSSWSTLSIVDSQTLYWGAYGTLVSTTATNHYVYIPKTGTIKQAHITVGCETLAGTGEAWPFYVRIDNTTDTLIESVAEDNVAIRAWDNTALSIAVTTGSYLEIKSVNPAWATNPIECYFGGYLYIE